MPSIRSIVSTYCACIVVLIFLLGEIMPIYSHCTEKKLVCVIIIAFSACQPSSYTKCIKLNMCSSYNIYSASNTEYIFLSGWFYSLSGNT